MKNNPPTTTKPTTIPNSNIFYSLSKEEQLAIKAAAAAYLISERANQVKEHFAIKSIEETWGAVADWANSRLLPFLHFVSGAVAFTGITYFFSLVFFLLPFGSIVVFDSNTLTNNVLLAELLGGISAMFSLFYVEKFKDQALKELFTKEVNPPILAQMGFAIWRLRLYVLFWVVFSFAAGYLGGSNTPKMLIEEPVLEIAKGLISIDSLNAANTAKIEALVAPTDKLIAEQEARIKGNQKALKNNPLNVGASKGLEAARKEKQRLSEARTKIEETQAASNALVLEEAIKHNKEIKTRVNTSNKKAVEKFENKVSLSSYILGGISLGVDFLILIARYLVILFLYKVGKENDALTRFLDSQTQPSGGAYTGGALKGGSTGATNTSGGATVTNNVGGGANISGKGVVNLSGHTKQVPPNTPQDQQRYASGFFFRQSPKNEPQDKPLEVVLQNNPLEIEKQPFEEAAKIEEPINQTPSKLEPIWEIENPQALAEAIQEEAVEEPKALPQYIEAEEVVEQAEGIVSQNPVQAYNPLENYTTSAKDFVIKATEYKGNLYDVAYIQNILKCFGTYYRRAIAPLSEKATGKTLEANKAAKERNAQAVELWRGILEALGVIVITSPTGSVQYYYPKTEKSA